MGIEIGKKNLNNLHERGYKTFQIPSSEANFLYWDCICSKTSAFSVTHDTINIHGSLVRASTCFHFIWFFKKIHNPKKWTFFSLLTLESFALFLSLSLDEKISLVPNSIRNGGGQMSKILTSKPKYKINFLLTLPY